MAKTKSGNLITAFRSNGWRSFIHSVLVINLINLSVNFAEKNQELEDPVDTVSEMIFEWCLEGDTEAIPDNGTEQEDQHLKPLKIFFVSVLGFSWMVEKPLLSQIGDAYISHFTPIFLSLSSPPPDLD